MTVPDEQMRGGGVVTARFRDGYVGRTLGWAKAWTPRAVEVHFPHPDPAVVTNVRRGGAGYRVWVPADDVTRDLSVLDGD